MINTGDVDSAYLELGNAKGRTWSPGWAFGHFPHRENPQQVSAAIAAHLVRHRL
jgi:hypothetical protein